MEFFIQPVVRSFASLTQGSMEDAARDGPCAHGKEFSTFQTTLSNCCPLVYLASLKSNRKDAHVRAARTGRLAHSPNQVLTHAARAAAKHLWWLQSTSGCKAPLAAKHLWLQSTSGCKAPLVAARGAREGLWLEQPCSHSRSV